MIKPIPVCEPDSVLLNINCSKLLVIPQSLFLFAGNTEIVTQLCIGFQFYAFTRIQTYLLETQSGKRKSRKVLAAVTYGVKPDLLSPVNEDILSQYFCHVTFYVFLLPLCAAN